MVESLDHRTTIGLRFLSDVKLFYEVYMPTSREREREFCLLCCLADSYYGQSLAIIVWLLYYNNVYWFSCYYCLMSDKKQLKGRGFISVEVSGDIVHYGQKAWKQNQLRCGHRRLSCQILADQKADKGNARTQQPPPPFYSVLTIFREWLSSTANFSEKKKILKDIPKGVPHKWPQYFWT